MGGGSGFAGGYGMPLEFSNVGRQSCTLYGYPGVSAVRGARQLGPAATRIPEARSLVTLAPGATASIEAPVRAPIPPGRYRLAFDLVAEAEGAIYAPPLRLPVSWPGLP